MVYPKIGTQGEYYHYNEIDPFIKNEKIFHESDTVVANYRYSYVEGGELRSKYLGDSVMRNQLREKPLK